MSLLSSKLNELKLSKITDAVAQLDWWHAACSCHIGQCGTFSSLHKFLVATVFMEAYETVFILPWFLLQMKSLEIFKS